MAFENIKLGVAMTLVALTFYVVPANAGPNRTTATFDRWVVQCTHPRDAKIAIDPKDAKKDKAKKDDKKSAGKSAKGKSVCKMVQTFAFQRTGQVLGYLVLTKIAGQDGMRAVAQMPLSAYLPNGVTIKVGDKKTYKGQFVRCLSKPRSCLAEFTLKNDDIKEFKTAKAASMTFTDFRRRNFKIPVSLKSFSGALDAVVNPKN